MNQSNVHDIGIAQSIKPVTKGAGLSAEETLGTGVDLQGFESASMVINLGTLVHADTTGAVTVQDSDDDVTYADVDAAYLLGDDAFTGLTVASVVTAGSYVRKKGYIGGKRYIRAKLVLTTGASTGSFPVDVSVIKGNPREAPVA